MTASLSEICVSGTAEGMWKNEMEEDTFGAFNGIRVEAFSGRYSLRGATAERECVERARRSCRGVVGRSRTVSLYAGQVARAVQRLVVSSSGRRGEGFPRNPMLFFSGVGVLSLRKSPGASAGLFTVTCEDLQVTREESGFVTSVQFIHG